MLRAACLILAIGLAGCLSQPRIDFQATQLMPEEVAMRIVAKYTSANWAARPTLNKPSKDWAGGCPEPRVTRIQYTEITNVYYDSLSRLVWVSKDGANALFGCPPDVFLTGTIRVANESQAQELANALASLGAKLKN